MVQSVKHKGEREGGMTGETSGDQVGIDNESPVRPVYIKGES